MFNCTITWVYRT